MVGVKGRTHMLQGPGPVGAHSSCLPVSQPLPYRAGTWSRGPPVAFVDSRGAPGSPEEMASVWSWTTPYRTAPCLSFPICQLCQLQCQLLEQQGWCPGIDRPWGKYGVLGVRGRRTQHCTTKPKGTHSQHLRLHGGCGIVPRLGLAGSPSHPHPAGHRARPA